MLICTCKGTERTSNGGKNPTLAVPGVPSAPWPAWDPSWWVHWNAPQGTSQAVTACGGWTPPVGCKEEQPGMVRVAMASLGKEKGRHQCGLGTTSVGKQRDKEIKGSSPSQTSAGHALCLISTICPVFSFNSHCSPGWEALFCGHGGLSTSNTAVNVTNTSETSQYVGAEPLWTQRVR